MCAHFEVLFKKHSKTATIVSTKHAVYHI